MTYNYKGYEIEKVTRVDFIIRENGKWSQLNGDWGHYPRTLKEAKSRIDNALNK